MALKPGMRSPGVGDPFYAVHSPERQQWFVISWAGSLAHKDGKAAFFEHQADADAYAIELCRSHYAETIARNGNAADC